MPNQYTEVHQNPQGPGDSRPTAQQVVDDEGLVGKWQDKTILITGTSSGIGVETARALATTGATLYCTVRDLDKGKNALADILSDRVQLLQMDQSSLASVRHGAREFLSRSGGKLNIFIGNAGIMMPPTRELTVDGFESQFATNHLAHFLLFQLLKDALIASSAPEFNSRVVLLKYTPLTSYGQSKTANLYTSNQIERLYGAKCLHALAVEPGGIMTGLQKHTSDELKKQWADNPPVQKILKSVPQGASTTVYAAVSKAWEGKGGRYMEHCDEAPPAKEGYSPIDPGYEPSYAYNEEGEKKLWEDSMKFVHL